MSTPKYLTPTSNSADRWLSRLVRLLRLPLIERWKIALRAKLANDDYLDAVRLYQEAEAAACNSFMEHNEASYHKGRRDAFAELLRLGKPNTPAEQFRGTKK